jgi:hypothetical protein
VRVAGWLAIGIGGLLLAFLAVTRIVAAAWNHEHAGRTISRWASASLAGEGGDTRQAFTFGSVDYPWLGAVASLLGGPPVRFDAWDVHIWDPGGREILHASHVAGGLRLGRLVGARLRSAWPWAEPDLELHFVDATVDGLRCGIELDPDGTANLVAAFAHRGPSAPAGTGGGMVISVEGALVQDGGYRMRFPGWEGGLEHFRMTLDSLRYSSFAAERRDDSPAFTYRVSHVEAPAGSLTVGRFSFPLERVVSTDFRAEEPRRQDMVLQGTAQSRGSLVEAHGRLSELYTAGRGVEFRIDLRHGAGVLASLPSSSLLGGDVSVTAHLHGPFGGVVIDGEAGGAQLHVAGLDIRHVRARYRLAARVLHLDRLASDVAGGHVRGEAALDWNAHTWRADLELEGIRTLQLGALAPVGVLAYLAGIPGLVLHATSRDPEATEQLRMEGVDVTLHRRARDLLPHRLTLTGRLGP